MRELNVILNKAADMAHNATADTQPTLNQLLGLLWEYTERLVEEAGGVVDLNRWQDEPPNELTLVVEMSNMEKVLVVAAVKERIQFRLDPIEFEEE